jgi:putative nucleotidyltransferase with HDIG domain
MGVIEAINKRNPAGFSDEDLNSLSSLAGHAAAAIHRSKTISDLKGDFVHLVDIVQSAIDNFMPHKKGHSRRVAKYSVKLARGLGLTEAEVRNIYFGAILHDIGLIKCSAFHASQDNGMYKLHTTLGWDMVKNISQWKDVGPMIRDHHERYDGCGYPSGLKGEEIDLGGRIIGLAEAFDVMTSSHSYKKARSFYEAAEEIRSLSAFQFDPMVAGVFLRDFTEDDVITGEA